MVNHIRSIGYYMFCLAFLFSDEAKEAFVGMLRDVEAFTGVQVLTYCVMTNHFHLLLKVHDPKPLSDKVLLARYEGIAAPITFAQFKGMWDRFADRQDEKGLEMLRGKLRARMNDLSSFMRELKQRFTRWYNITHGKSGGGTFWSDRYKSVLVEGRGNTLSTMAAYIDLNPVRAEMVKDPREYRWCGYAAALAGHRKAQVGLQVILGEFMANRLKTDVLPMYRMMLFGVMETKKSGLVTLEEVVAVYEAQGMLPPWEMGKHRLKWFTEGMIIGGKRFVSRVAGEWNDKLGLKRRKGRQECPDEAGWCRLRAMQGD